MSPRSSEAKDPVTDKNSDPLRPSDHMDGSGRDSSEREGINQPKLGFVGWLRWGWRQLTSMRTAIVLLLVLAIAAIPGSIFPQRMADPNGVTQWEKDNPDLFPVLDSLDLFDVYLSPWFSAIYLLLFISLVGCVIPRIKHHIEALRARPPRTPVRLKRLEHHQDVTIATDDAEAEAARSIDVAQKQLKALGYRVERFDKGNTYSVSAERGYWRETGNLVFHLSLVGVLITVGVGGGFAYTGQKVVTEGQTFVNSLVDYSSMNRGRFVADDALSPYAMTLESFDVTYEEYGSVASGQAGNFSANVRVRDADGSEWDGSVVVNKPLSISGDSVYLLGNGYAPTITVRNADDEIVYKNSVEFISQDNNMTSVGVVKVTDGMPDQLGMSGFFYPTVAELDTGALTSIHGDLVLPMLTLNVFEGDLGIDDGTPRSVYVLDTTDMTRLTGGDTDVESIKLMPGETAELPNGLGTITFEDESPEGATDYSESVKRYVSLQIHHDASAVWVLVFALLALGGLMLGLFVPRRRMWVKASAAEQSVTVEYAGLARGEDPTLGGAVESLAAGHARLMEAAEIARVDETDRAKDETAPSADETRK